MSKVRTCDISPNERYRILGEFFEIVANLKNKKDTIDFFVGLLTPSESLMLARRIQVAKLIIANESYDEIRRKLKVGFTTIYATDRWLNGEDDRYCEWIKKLISKYAKIEQKETGMKTSMLDKYAHHRIIKKLLS